MWLACHRVEVAFVLTHICVYVGALALLGAQWYPSSPLTVLWTLVLTLPLAFELSDVLLVLLPSVAPLPKLDSLTRKPKVALLYLTCDDVVPSALASITTQSYASLDTFILDDSTQPISSDLVPASARLVRRSTREGYKAGNLNHWLWKFGAGYEYAVVLDSDSVLPADFVESMLLYGEHPANSHVALFQAITLPSSPTSQFQNLLAAGQEWRMRLSLKLFAHSESILSWGHNNVVRTSALFEIGGFDERFVAEDAATSLSLIRQGHQCRLVDVASYESLPVDLEAFAARTLRWARQTVQMLGADWRGIALATRLQLVRPLVTYLLNPLFLVAAAGAVFFDTAGSPMPVQVHWLGQLMVGAATALLVTTATILTKWPLARRVRTPFKTFVVSQLALVLASACQLVSVSVGVVRQACGDTVAFTPTRKVAPTRSRAFRNGLVNAVMAVGFGTFGAAIQPEQRLRWIALAVFFGLAPVFLRLLEAFVMNVDLPDAIDE